MFLKINKLKNMRKLKDKIFQINSYCKNKEDKKIIYIILTEMLLSVSAKDCDYHIHNDNDKLIDTLNNLLQALKQISIENLKDYTVTVHNAEREMVKIKA